MQSTPASIAVDPVLSTQVDDCPAVIPAADRGGRDTGIRQTTCKGTCYKSSVSLNADRARFTIDWLQVSVPAESLDRARTLITQVTGRPFSPRRVPLDQRYRVGEESGGVQLYSGSRYRNGTACVVIPGSAQPTDHLQLLAELIALGGRATRVDFAFDDLAGITSVSGVWAAVKAGTQVTRYQNCELRESMSLHGGGSSTTLAFGSRKSNTYLRVYERSDGPSEPEVGGYDEAGLSGSDGCEIDGTYTRWELEVKHETAHKAVLETLAYDPSTGLDITPADFPNDALVERFREKGIELLTTRLSFRRRDATSNVTRAPMQAWWKAFVDYVEVGAEPQAAPESAQEKPAAGDGDQGIGKLELHVLDYDEAQRQVSERRSRRAEAARDAERVLSSLYEEFREGFGDFSRLGRKRGDYRPRLRLVHGARCPLPNQRRPARLQLVGGTDLTRHQQRPPLQLSDVNRGGATSDDSCRPNYVDPG